MANPNLITNPATRLALIVDAQLAAGPSNFTVPLDTSWTVKSVTLHNTSVAAVRVQGWVVGTVGGTARQWLDLTIAGSATLAVPSEMLAMLPEEATLRLTPAVGGVIDVLISGVVTSGIGAAAPGGSVSPSDLAAAIAALPVRSDNTDVTTPVVGEVLTVTGVGPLAMALIPATGGTQLTVDGVPVSAHNISTTQVDTQVAASATSRVSFPLPRVNDWLAQHAGDISVGQTANGELLSGTMFLPGGTYNAVAFHVDVAGGAGSAVKVIAYADLNARPGALILDTATASTTTNGQKQITGFSLVIPAGGRPIWVGTVGQGSPSVNPTLWRVRTATCPTVFENNPQLDFVGSPCYVTLGITGAAPASAGTGTFDGHTRVAFRRSA